MKKLKEIFQTMLCILGLHRQGKIHAEICPNHIPTGIIIYKVCSHCEEPYHTIYATIKEYQLIEALASHLKDLPIIDLQNLRICAGKLEIDMPDGILSTWPDIGKFTQRIEVVIDSGNDTPDIKISLEPII